MTDRAKLILILILSGMGWTYGCAQHGPDTSAKKPPTEKVSSPTPPSIPSKGTGIKKRLPVIVTSGDRLSWVDNAIRTYPPDRFHTGLGIGPNRQTAQDRSLAELEKPFSSAITGRLESSIKAMGMTASDWALSATIDRYRQRTLTTIRSHSRVAEVFLEKKPADTYYALAVMDRQACTDQLEAMVRGLDHELEAMVTRLDKTDVSVTPKERSALMGIYADRLALDAAISVLMPKGNESPPPVQSSTIGRIVKKK